VRIPIWNLESRTKQFRYSRVFVFLFPRAVETMTKLHALHRIASADQNGHLILPKLFFGLGANLNIVQRNGALAGIHVNCAPPMEPRSIAPPQTGHIEGKGVISGILCDSLRGPDVTGVQPCVVSPDI
jgi:hypothetical protein